MPSATSGIPQRGVPPAQFFGLKYLLAWLVWAPLVFSRFEIEALRIANELRDVIRLPGVLMPGIAAIVPAAVVDSGESLRALPSRQVVAEVGLGHWLPLTVVPLACVRFIVRQVFTIVFVQGGRR